MSLGIMPYTENWILICQGSLPYQDAVHRMVKRNPKENISAPTNPDDKTTHAGRLEILKIFSAI